MIRLGHIVYSNCFPVHARLVDGEPPTGIVVVPGVPSELNEQLADGRIDVAPCSSIEYARRPGEYTVLPDLAIASAGRVQSILLESVVPPEELGGRDVLVPTVSATSVVLLRILLEKRFGVKARLHWFDQRAGDDPLGGGAAAVLWIGDVALRRVPRADRSMLDLGEAWWDWTGMPFAYAIWQVRQGVNPDDLEWLHGLLLESRSWFEANTAALAGRHAAHFGIDAARLARYWRSLRYTLDPETERGLLHFFQLSAELEQSSPVDAIDWACPAAR